MKKNRVLIGDDDDDDDDGGAAVKNRKFEELLPLTGNRCISEWSEGACTHIYL